MTTGRSRPTARGAPPRPRELRADFERGLGFALDGFQIQAMDALDRGESVLVAAPTGSGKTLVADYAAARALEGGGKTFYTTPIKALSNQKFAELSARYGAGRVGLLTGDVSHQPAASIVVMTTEVLRNMLFSRSHLLSGLAVVVLDEVHYLEDPYRGSVWEEILVLAPPGVIFVSLSATVSNTAEFGAWLASVRGPTAVVLETRRPVTLHHHFAVGERGRDDLLVIPLLRKGQANPDGTAFDERRRRHQHRGYRTPRRVEVVEYLADSGMLPAIHFIFSRAACDDATRQCLDDGVRLTSPEERLRIRSLTEEAVERLADDDLRTLGYGPWSAALEAGIAPHHAGLVPAFRQAVERCFTEGLLKVVFATETLALGINMPARTVVIERFAKFRGADISALTSGEYRQLTGRAGRRGIDTVGHAFVLWSRAGFVPADRSDRPRTATRSRLLLPPDLQPRGQSGAPLDTGRGPRTARRVLRAVAGAGGFGVARGTARPSARDPRRARLRGGLAADPRGPSARRHLSRIGPARRRSTTGRGSSTTSIRRGSPAWPPRWCSRHGTRVGTSEGRRSPRSSPVSACWSSSRPRCGPTSDGSASDGLVAPTPGLARAVIGWGRGATLDRGAARRGGRARRLRAQRPPARRPRPPDRPGGRLLGDPGDRRGGGVPAPAGRRRERRAGGCGVRHQPGTAVLV